MAINNNNSNGSNQAGPGSHQNNSIVNVGKQEYNIKEMNIKVVVDNFLEANSLEAIFKNFLRSIAGDIAVPKSHPTRISHTRYCFVRDYQETSCVGGDYDKCLRRYPKFKTTKCILEILKPKDGQHLRDWQSSQTSDSLILNLQGERKERSGWTTNFTLEMIGCIIQTDNPIGAGRSSAFVAHFCSEQLDAEEWTEEAILREFLVQIRTARYADLIACHNCETQRGTDHMFHSAAKHPRDLWELLRYSVVSAGIKSLYVFLDNLDYIDDRANRTVLEKFYDNIRTFLQDSQQNGVRVKLLITSRSSKIVRYFPGSRGIVLSQTSDDRIKSVTSR